MTEIASRRQGCMHKPKRPACLGCSRRASTDSAAALCGSRGSSGCEQPETASRMSTATALRCGSVTPESSLHSTCRALRLRQGGTVEVEAVVGDLYAGVVLPVAKAQADDVYGLVVGGPGLYDLGRHLQRARAPLRGAPCKAPRRPLFQSRRAPRLRRDRPTQGLQAGGPRARKGRRRACCVSLVSRQ